MKTMCGKLITALALATAAGCASIEISSPGVMDGLDVVGGDTPATETIVVRNSGFDIFYAFTLVCGDVDYNPVTKGVNGGCLFFTDKSQCADCYRTMQAFANGENKPLTNVSMFNNSLPSGSILGDFTFIGFFFEFQDTGCSGVLRAKR